MQNVAAAAESLSRTVGVDLTQTFLGNTLFAYIAAIVAFVVFAALFKLLQWHVLRRLAKLARRTETDIDDTLIEIVWSLRPAFYYFVAFFLALQFLELSEVVQNVANGVLVIWVVYQIVIAIQILIDRVLQKRMVGEDADPSAKAAIGYLKVLAKVALWSVGVLLVLSNFGVNITSLVAGLGIGGVAIAFALQNILGDLFSSFAIYFDKPFEIGDFIVVGSHMGTVERIGIKTTRLRSLSGEEIVISNQELTSTRVQNYKRMQRRRILFTFGVLYETPTEKVKQISDIVHDIVTEAKDTELDRAHFKAFGDSSLDFEVVYYMTVPDYNVYMDRQQEINFALKERFEKEGIEFAYPTRTVYLAK